MPPAILPPKPRWPLGPANELHIAARDGDAEHAAALLSAGWIDVNQGDPGGWTSLMIACLNGQSAVIRVLLDHDADKEIVRQHSGFTALLFAAHHGHHKITKMLLDAGADPDYAAPHGSTSLHLAAEKGHSRVIRCLLQAGAEVDPRMLEGETPLYHAAFDGRLGAVRELLRWGADSRIKRTNEAGMTFVALDMAAQNGHLPVVRELLDQLGLEICGGSRFGADALRQAAKNQHLDILATLAEAGVVDDVGDALVVAVAIGREASVAFLMRQHREKRERETSGSPVRVCGIRPLCASPRYVDHALDRTGGTPVIQAVGASGHCNPRILRMLIDAGGDTKSPQGTARDTPISLVQCSLRCRKVAGSPATPSQLRKLEAVRRLLLCADAARAVSWAWPAIRSGDDLLCPRGKGGISHEHAEDGSSDSAEVAATGDGGGTATAVVPLVLVTSPVRTRGAGGTRVFLAAVERYVITLARGLADVWCVRLPGREGVHVVAIYCLFVRPAGRKGCSWLYGMAVNFRVLCLLFGRRTRPATSAGRVQSSSNESGASSSLLRSQSYRSTVPQPLPFAPGRYSVKL